MSQQHVLLYGHPGLLVQGIQDILERQDEIVVHGPYPPRLDAAVHIEARVLDAIIVASQDAAHSALVAHILQAYPDLPIICADLEENKIRIYRSEQTTATSTNLLNAIP